MAKLLVLAGASGLGAERRWSASHKTHHRSIATAGADTGPIACSPKVSSGLAAADEQVAQPRQSQVSVLGETAIVRARCQVSDVRLLTASVSDRYTRGRNLTHRAPGSLAYKYLVLPWQKSEKSLDRGA